MDVDVQDVLIHGVISLVLSVVITYGVSLVIPTDDLTWALYAVAFAGFFSSASSAYIKNQE
jgi:hypothetical protein